MSRVYTKDQLAAELAAINATTEVLKGINRELVARKKLRILGDFSMELLELENKQFHDVNDKADKSKRTAEFGLT